MLTSRKSRTNYSSVTSRKRGSFNTISNSVSVCAQVVSACELDEHQLEKLQGAAVVDATRFTRNLQLSLQGVGKINRPKLDPVNLRGELNEELSLGINNPTSLFRKIFLTVLTHEQQVLLYRSKANSLLNAIDKLSAAQRERLLELIVDRNQSEIDFWQFVTQPQTINLLRVMTREELAKFLTPLQVQAVLIQRTAIDKRGRLC